jgi:hypothetical protein
MAAREAIHLPLLFLTVVLAGGIHVAERVTMRPPSLFGLVLAIVLLGLLVRSGALAAERLMHASRPRLANLNGFVAIAAAVLASAQAFTLATPESGLPRVLVSLFLLILLLNTLAASPDRPRVLRSLLVIFGSTFTLKFVVLAALSDPAGGRMARVLKALFEGATLGTLSQAPVHPATSYLAFATLALFLVGMAMLPGRAARFETGSKLEPASPLEGRMFRSAPAGSEGPALHEGSALRERPALRDDDSDR